jgi:predicted DCC family thiol-disulfide oxidoreductase YuxK
MGDGPQTKTTWTLFYDGTCNFCHSSQQRVAGWARASGQPLQVETLQGDAALSRGYSDQMILEAEGRVYRAGEAWLKAMEIAPWYLRWVSWARLTRPTKALALAVYNFIARNRYRIMGRRNPAPSCSVGGG